MLTLTDCCSGVKMEILFADEEQRVKVHSSIDQYRKFIATYERGGWTPIQFDYFDYIECVDCKEGGKYRVATHPVIIEFDDQIGYHFPLGSCNITTDDYLVFDQNRVELEPLDECDGDGFYEAYKGDREIVNFDNAGLGVRNRYRLKIGQDYYLATEFLPADDAD